MWVLENEGEALEGKRLWLRPGRRYLFGRTVVEPGQLVIQGPGSEKVSRKHVVIKVDAVEDGHAEVMGTRATVTVEDLGSKGGTKMNGEKYKNTSRILSQDSNTLQMGSYPFIFRITWVPVILSFSFTGNELRTNPINRLRQTLEQLDIKLLSDYDTQLTTHVVSKKRNTPKGLLALINGKYIVTDSFVNAITRAAESNPPSDETANSPLGQDFDANWPDPMAFLPAPGEKDVSRPSDLFAPNPARADVFNGYTFVFYDEKQYDNLLATVTSGRGKALLHRVVQGETQVDDFIRYVKGVAGESGLGEFEDGSEGKGVVVVKWMPGPTDESGDWFEEFYRSISLRLDHRLMDQKQFLDAIVLNDASILRRPLESATQQPRNGDPKPVTQPMEEQAMDVEELELPASPSPPRPTTRRRARQPAKKSRFSGFGITLEDDPQEEPAPAASALQPAPAVDESSQEGLFVTQPATQTELEPGSESTRTTRQSQSLRKRPTSSRDEIIDIMEKIAPTAAQAKRRRIAAGEDPTPTLEESPVPPNDEAPKAKEPRVKKEKELDVLEIARQNREEAEQRAKQEKEDLATTPDDLDMLRIRRLHIQENMPLREIPQERTREQDIADGRWNPAWNGRKNFKRFQQRGATQGRGPERIIVALEEVKSKGFGIGDSYWLNDGETQKGRKKDRSQEDTQADETATSQRKAKEKEVRRLFPLDSSDDDSMMNDTNDNNNDKDGVDDDDDDEEPIIPSSSRTRSARGSTAKTQTQSQKGKKTTGKRQAAAPPAKQQPASKKAKRTMTLEPSDDDDSDDGLRFRFGKR